MSDASCAAVPAACAMAAMAMPGMCGASALASSRAWLVADTAIAARWYTAQLSGGSCDVTFGAPGCAQCALAEACIQLCSWGRPYGAGPGPLTENSTRSSVHKRQRTSVVARGLSWARLRALCIAVSASRARVGSAAAACSAVPRCSGVNVRAVDADRPALASLLPSWSVPSWCAVAAGPIAGHRSGDVFEATHADNSTCSASSVRCAQLGGRYGLWYLRACTVRSHPTTAISAVRHCREYGGRA